MLNRKLRLTPQLCCEYSAVTMAPKRLDCSLVSASILHGDSLSCGHLFCEQSKEPLRSHLLLAAFSMKYRLIQNSSSLLFSWSAGTVWAAYCSLHFLYDGFKRCTVWLSAKTAVNVEHQTKRCPSERCSSCLTKGVQLS